MRNWRRLHRWVDEEAQSARVYRRLADSAGLHAENKAGLFRDPDLQIAISWREQQQPTAAWADQYGGGFEVATAFLDRSLEEARKADREREDARRRELDRARELAHTQAAAADV